MSRRFTTTFWLRSPKTTRETLTIFRSIRRRERASGTRTWPALSCCNGTALESNTKLQDSIYFKSSDNSALYVNLYVPSTLTWKEKNAVVKQETNFPYADSTKLTITGA